MVGEQKRILINIDPIGNVKVEAENFHGVGCEAATKGIEDALSGGSGIDRVMKPEWSESEEQQEQLHW